MNERLSNRFSDFEIYAIIVIVFFVGKPTFFLSHFFVFSFA